MVHLLYLCCYGHLFVKESESMDEPPLTRECWICGNPGHLDLSPTTEAIFHYGGEDAVRTLWGGQIGIALRARKISGKTS